MLPFDRAVGETDLDADPDPPPASSRRVCGTACEWWPPRPSTILAALLVGCSLFLMNGVDAEFALNLSGLYGWPFTYRDDPAGVAAASGPRSFHTLALMADLAIALVLLAASCVTTQMAACLLVRKPRVTLRVLGLVVAGTALFLAAYRLRENFLSYVLHGGFYYSVASLMVLVACWVFHLELPAVEEPAQDDSRTGDRVPVQEGSP